MDFDFQAAIEQADRGQNEPRPQSPRGSINMEDGVIPIFHVRETYDATASEAEGRPIYNSIDWIEIICPGSKDRVERPVNSRDKARFPQAWESYTRGDEHKVAGGTPITQWQAIPRQRAMELRAMGFYTVEALAVASETAIQRMGMDARTLVKSAVDFLANKTEADDERKRRAEVEAQLAERDAKIAELQQKMAALTARMGADNGADSASDSAGGGAQHRNRSADKPGR